MQNKELTDKSKLSKKECSFLILSAVLIISIASTSSPLFPLNPWDDANCFLTVGRGIIKGLVPYRDLYEQKGPVLYLVHALCSLVPGRSFTGVWLLESLMASIFAIYSWKSVKLFIKPSAIAIGFVPLFLSVIYTTRVFNFGDSAEELCFPLLSIVLFYALKAILTENNLPGLKEGFICGLIAGLLLWTKYTFTAFIGAYCLLIIVYSVIHREFKRLFSLIGLFIAGAAAATLPVILYFGIKAGSKVHDNPVVISGSTMQSGTCSPHISITTCSFTMPVLIKQGSFQYRLLRIWSFRSWFSSDLEKNTSLSVYCLST